jgi:uncharacterized phage-associated protein
MVTSLMVANTLIYHALDENVSMSPMKLQKLIYSTFAVA